MSELSNIIEKFVSWVRPKESPEQLEALRKAESERMIAKTLQPYPALKTPEEKSESDMVFPALTPEKKAAYARRQEEEKERARLLEEGKKFEETLFRNEQTKAQADNRIMDDARRKREQKSK